MEDWKKQYEELSQQYEDYKRISSPRAPPDRDQQES